MTSKTLQVTISNSGKVKICRFKLYTNPIVFLPSISDLFKMYDPLDCPYRLWLEVDGKNIYYMTQKLAVRQFANSSQLGDSDDIFYTSKNITGFGYMVGEFGAKCRIEMPRKFSVSFRR